MIDSSARLTGLFRVKLSNPNIGVPNAKSRTRLSFEPTEKRSSISGDSTVSSLLFLPATVAETNHVDIEKSEISDSPHLLDTQNDQAMEMMNDTQGNNDESTQPISQSLYRSIIQKGRSLMSSRVNIDEEHDVEQEAADTQRTFEPGDLGHVDIMSSFVTGQVDADEMQRFDRVDFSPTQSQHNLTQFPESQRFKTPATVGRKRNFNGEPIESPTLPRNPLRNGPPASESDKVMGLSQVFAGTQAGSSPFTNGLLAELRSNRPSPDVELQTRPVAATSSSPLRPLSEFRRTVVEPASKYVSVRQSQAERERQVVPTFLDNDDTDPEFGEEPAYIIQARRQKQRRERVNQDLKRLSSPIAEQEPGYSRTNSDETQMSLADEQVDPAAVIARTTAHHSKEQHDSEVETEQENEYIGSSLPASPDEDDKENQVVDVPRTVTSNRLQNFIGVVGSSSRIDASLSTHTTPRVSQVASMPSSAFQDVPNSQPGDERRRQLLSAKAIPNSRRTLSPDPLNAAVPLTMVQTTVYTEVHDRATNVQDDTNAVQIETLPSTNDIISTNPKENESGALTTARGTPQPAKSPSKMMAYASHNLLQPSAEATMAPAGHLRVSPMTALPSERRRGRLMDISAEASPSRSAPAFDANQALGLDQDSEHATYFLPEALRSPMRTPKHRRLMRTHESDEINERHAIIASGDVVQGDTHSGPPTSSSDMLAYSQEIVLPRPQRLLTKSTNSGTQASESKRASVWDFEISPQKSIPKANERKKMPPRANQTTKVGRRLSQDVTAPAAGRRSPPKSDGVSGPEASATIEESDPRDSRDQTFAPNMVFACFNGKTRAYYPAICLGIASEEPKRYQIQWEGYDPDEVDAYGVRPLDLQIGDSVKVNLAGVSKIPYIVRGFKDIIGADTTDLCDVRGHQTLNVVPKHRKDMPNDRETHDIDVPVKSIYLDSNMWGQLKDRAYDFVSTTRTELAGYATPADRSTTPNTPSSRRRTAPLTTSTSLSVVKSGLFANMVFAVSYEDLARKNSLVKQIQQNGGVVLGDSFPEMLETDKIELRASHRHLGFTALLTESYSRKEKYIQALALGLPCLSGRWIEASIELDTLRDWRDYLLPAGESAELDGAVRSRILSTFPATTVSLSEMLDTRPMMLQDASVIVITGRGKVEMRSTKYIFMIRALGASRIERVLDIKAAQQLLDAESSFQWIFVDDKDLATSQTTLILDRSKGSSRGKQHSSTKTSSSQRRCQIASHDFIVQSLILGHLIRS